MKRTFTAMDLVRMPKLDALAAQTLATEVITNAKAIMADKSAAKKIPEGVVEAVEDVEITLGALNDVAAARLPLAKADNPQRATAADIALDAVYSGMLDLLDGWSKIPGLPEAEIAASLKSKLFPDGLKFTQIVYKRQWAQSDTRVRVIQDQYLEPLFAQLGAEKLIEKLYETHAEYGEALGITSPAEAAEEEAATLRGAFDDLMAALRVFVVRASAMSSKKDAKRSELAEKLLAPIMAWEMPAGRSKADAQPGEGGEQPEAAAPVSEASPA